MHNLVHELVDSAPEFLGLFQDYFTLWLDAITHVFKPSYPPDIARTLAQDIVSRLGGAIMMDRLYRTTRYVQRVEALMHLYVSKEVEVST